MGNTRVYGANLRALAVYLLIVQHVPVERCVRLIADLAGTAVSAGFVHKILAAVAAAVTDVVTAINTLITLAAGLFERFLEAVCLQCESLDVAILLLRDPRRSSRCRGGGGRSYNWSRTS